MTVRRDMAETAVGNTIAKVGSTVWWVPKEIKFEGGEEMVTVGFDGAEKGVRGN